MTWMKLLWQQLDRSPQRLEVKLYFNMAESDSSHSSRAQRPRVRPDTMAVANMCTLLVGEDKLEDLEAAVADLKEKRVDLERLHYRDVRFLVGYAAAGTRFQWYILPDKADQVGCTLHSWPSAWSNMMDLTTQTDKQLTLCSKMCSSAGFAKHLDSFQLVAQVIQTWQ